MLNLLQFCSDLIVEENKQSKYIIKIKCVGFIFYFKTTSEDRKNVKDYVAVISAFFKSKSLFC